MSHNSRDGSHAVCGRSCHHDIARPAGLDLWNFGTWGRKVGIVESRVFWHIWLFGLRFLVEVKPAGDSGAKSSHENMPCVPCS